MTQDPADTTGRNRKNWIAWGVLLAMLGVFGAAVLLYPTMVDENDATGDSGRTAQSLGTAGSDEPRGTDDNAGHGAVLPSAIIHELETITGTNDGHELIGRRVDLHVPVQQHINDVAFWVGMGDNRILVVLGRDDRDGETRQRGGPSTTGVQFAQAEQVAVSGSIQQLPHAEAMFSWGLTNADRAELNDRPIYIRADTVTANEAAQGNAPPNSNSPQSASTP